MASQNEGVEDIIARASSLTVGLEATEEAVEIKGDGDEETEWEGVSAEREIIAAKSIVGRVFAKKQAPGNFYKLFLDEGGVLRRTGQ